MDARGKDRDRDEGLWVLLDRPRVPAERHLRGVEVAEAEHPEEALRHAERNEADVDSLGAHRGFAFTHHQRARLRQRVGQELGAMIGRAFVRAFIDDELDRDFADALVQQLEE